MRWLLVISLLVILTSTVLAIVIFSPVVKDVLGEQIIATVRPNPLMVTVSVNSPILVKNQTFIGAEVKNQGPYLLKDASATIFLPAGLKLISGSSTNNLGRIQGGKSKSARWRIQALEPGNYIILVEAKATDEPTGTILTASGSALLVVKSSTQKLPIWQKLLPTVKTK